MTNKNNIYIADDGNTIIRKYDTFVMGHIIDLGTSDSIDNYSEVPLTKENDIEGLLEEDKNE